MPSCVLSGDALEPGRLTHLYLRHGLSTYQIAARAGTDRQRVTRALRKASVPLRPRGAGRGRPERRSGGPPDLPRIVRELYQEGRLSSAQIAVVLGLPERTVRDRLRRYGIKTRTPGRWNREDRTTVPVSVLRVLYTELGMTAAEAGQRLGVSGSTVLRNAHALGVPVRSGGSVNERFPEPLPLSTPLVKDLYWGCGAGLNHIELLTGQAAESVRGFMRRSGIPLRHPGGRTPFMRRWRSGGTAGGARLSARRPPRPVHDARRAERAEPSGKGDAQ